MDRGKRYVNQIVEILADTDQEQHNDTNCNNEIQLITETEHDSHTLEDA